MQIAFFLAVIFLALCPTIISAQTHFGVKGGLNISDVVMTNYIDPDVESEMGLKPGIHAGVFVSGTIHERWAMVAELLYSNKGMRAGSNVNLHYITVPLLARYQLSDKLFAELGFEPGYLLSAMTEHGNANNTYNNKFDLAIDGGFALELSPVVIGLRYSAGLFSVRAVEFFNAPDQEKLKYQNRVLQLSLGYRLFTRE